MVLDQKNKIIWQMVNAKKIIHFDRCLNKWTKIKRRCYILLKIWKIIYATYPQITKTYSAIEHGRKNPVYFYC